jgi:hypothetical protein
MNATLAKHLWRSPDVRRALKKEGWRLLTFAVIYVGTVAVSRSLREKPVFDGVLSTSIGAGAVALAWSVSALRTLRAVLRDHDMLKR